MHEKKLFGKYNEIALLCIGSLLTVIGALLMFALQFHEERYEDKVRLQEVRRANAEHFLDGFSKTYGNQLAVGINCAKMRMQTANAVDLMQDNLKLIQARDEWLIECSRDGAMIRIYFGQSMSDDLFTNISQDYNTMFQDAMNVTPHDTNSLNKAIASLLKVATETGAFVGRGYGLIERGKLNDLNTEDAENKK
jgi:hypothetical protein